MKSELTKWEVDFKVLNRMLQRGKKIRKKNETDGEKWKEEQKWSNTHLITVLRV